LEIPAGGRSGSVGIGGEYDRSVRVGQARRAWLYLLAVPETSAGRLSTPTGLCRLTPSPTRRQSLLQSDLTLFEPLMIDHAPADSEHLKVLLDVGFRPSLKVLVIEASTLKVGAVGISDWVQLLGEAAQKFMEELVLLLIRKRHTGTSEKGGEAARPSPPRSSLRASG
jgi:hypothetical protein